MRLLASVISALEAELIADLADSLDVKNPSRGALGAPDVSTIREIRARIGSHVLLSSAMGELDPETVELARAMAASGADIVKTALAGIERAEALDQLRAVRKFLPKTKRLVVAAYADAGTHGFFDPRDLPILAHEAGADGILIDTCQKDGLGLFDFIQPNDLRKIVVEARGYGLMTAIAGSLGLEDIPMTKSVLPDWIGFRSAITASGIREEEGVDREKVILLKDILMEKPAGAFA